MFSSEAFKSSDEHDITFFPALKMEQEHDEGVMFQQADFFSTAFPMMDEIRRQGKFCDVILKAGDRSISAHRIVLASTIPYFHGMFTNNMVESTQKEITMQGVDPTALESLVNFAYTGCVKINDSNIQPLMVGSSYLQLNQVRDACADFLKRRFHPQNVVGIRQFAETLACALLVDACNSFIDGNFSEVSICDEFYNMPLEDLKDVIKRNELQVSNEEVVFEAVMRWANYKTKERADCLPQLLSCVRLPLLTPHYLADRVATEEMIRSSHQCRDLVDEAKDYHLMPERQFLIQGSRTKPRTAECFAGIIYAVGGLTKTGDSLSTVEAYSPAIGRWIPAEAMSTVRSRVGVAALRGRLYALGGYNGSERLATVEAYDLQSTKWSMVASMSRKRSAVGACSLGNHVYVYGGYDGYTSLHTVERYCPLTDSWEKISPMNKFRSAGGGAALRGCVWALGGHDGLSIFDSVERYDPRAGIWEKQKPMLTKRCRLGVATLNDKLYVCGGYDGSTFLQSVEEYDPVNNQWRCLSSMTLMRSRVALVANMGKLWAIGGYNGETNLRTVEVYDPAEDSWSFVAPMCAHEGGVGVGVLPDI
ncbi:kelch like family member 18 [Arctopsyche grandis]|uniref:kelch like family member 18 n=1 Tax=Arctopsyche grandis TaxID=121162 RepID=UPI00406D7F97